MMINWLTNNSCQCRVTDNLRSSATKHLLTCLPRYSLYPRASTQRDESRSDLTNEQEESPMCRLTPPWPRVSSSLFVRSLTNPFHRPRLMTWRSIPLPPIKAVPALSLMASSRKLSRRRRRRRTRVTKTLQRISMPWVLPVFFILTYAIS